MKQSEIEAQTQEALEKAKKSESIRAARVKHVGYLGKKLPHKAEQAIKILSHPKLSGNDAVVWIGAFAITNFYASVDALKKIGSPKAIERLVWMASDRINTDQRAELPDIVKALKDIQTDEAFTAADHILHNDSLRSVPELQRYLSVRKEFNAHAQTQQILEAEKSISRIALSITGDHFEARLQSSSAIPVLRDVLNEAVLAVPSLAQEKRVKQAIEKLYAAVLKPD